MIWQLLNTQLKGFLKSALLNTVNVVIGSLDAQALPIFVILLWIMSLPHLMFVRNPPKAYEPKVNPNNVNLGSQADDM